MAFTVNNFADLTHLLAEHPEWRADLLRLLLPAEFQALPAITRDLVEAQRQSEARLTRLEALLGELVEAQRRTEERLDALAEAQRRTEERLDALAEAQRQSEVQLKWLATSVVSLADQVKRLVEAQQRTYTILADHRGQLLELRYRAHVGGYFGQWLKRARAVAAETLEEQLETSLTHDELLQVLRLDLLVSGRLRDRPDSPEVLLAVEVSGVVEETDIFRARHRAELLQRAGYVALPVAAGESVANEAESIARMQKVAIVQDGQGVLWEEALAAWGQGAPQT